MSVFFVFEKCTLLLKITYHLVGFEKNDGTAKSVKNESESTIHKTARNVK